jgi:hypothetical protein
MAKAKYRAEQIIPMFPALLRRKQGSMISPWYRNGGADQCCRRTLDKAEESKYLSKRSVNPVFMMLRRVCPPL